MGASTRNGGRSGRRLLWWTITAVVILALVATASVVIALRLDREPELPPGVPPQPAAIAVDPRIDPVVASAPEPTPSGVSRAIAPAAPCTMGRQSMAHRHIAAAAATPLAHAAGALGGQNEPDEAGIRGTSLAVPAAAADGTAPLLVGRALRPGHGPCVVTVRGGDVVDITSREAPTRDRLNRHIRRARTRRVPAVRSPLSTDLLLGGTQTETQPGWVNETGFPAARA